MNPQILPLDPQTQPVAFPELGEVVPDSLADALPKIKKRRPTGKIAELPQEQKDLINRMLDDGKSYRVIEAEMAKLGVSLNGENISNWFNGPYQDYVRDREWRDDLLTLAQSASTLGDLSFGQKFQDSLIQLAFVDIFRALKDPETRADRPNHIRLLNSLARLNREALCARKYNDLRADKVVAQLKPANGAPTDEDYRNSFLLGFEKVTGIKPADGPIGPDLNLLLGLDPPSQSASASSSASSSIPFPQSASDSDSSSSSASSSSVSSSNSIPLINSPIHPGESAPRDEATVSTVSDRARADVLKSEPVQASPEECHCCRQELPPLLPSGERPSPHCNKCGTPLRAAGALIEYCPKCRHVLTELKNDGTRPTPECLNCNKPLPPPPSSPPRAAVA
jgi:hypothetical protein